MEITNKYALVTGGASGLGAACVRLLLAEGAGGVAIFDYNEETGKAISEELGDKVLFVKTDVSDDEQVKAGVDRVIAKFASLHIVINCAGVGTPAKVLSQKRGMMTFDSFAKVININLIGTMNVIRHTSEKMFHNEATNADGEKGVFINTASVAAYDGQIGQAAYSASKGGLVGLTLPIAREFADYGMRVMTIAPGLFHTPMMDGLPEKAREALAASTPFPKRLGRADEYAALAKSIIENTMLSGETIRLDGAVRLA
ncbi:MAG: SDR family NAD(P)-dependent oxidoreductase [SAR324 cluster bacterium]|nr:SDR family NAD(P)-dependent oxidoreductase [SAR324 cluster bacterium]